MTNYSCEDGFFLQISSLELGGPVHSLRLLPLPGPTMTDVRVFHRRLARARKRFNKRKETDDRAFGDMSLHKSTINHIINTIKFVKNVDDQGHLNVKKTWRTQALIPAVAASVDRDAWVTVQYLALANQVSISTIFDLLYEELGLEKKCARWVPKLLSLEQKEERIRI